MKEIKTFLIGFLTCACLFLIMGQTQADNDDVGFLTIKKHFSETAEIHCMGILPQYHRKGIGKLLIKELENNLKNDGFKILQVKTISEESACKFYAQTREFYKSVGFIPLEVFPKLWDESNPCLQLVKQL